MKKQDIVSLVILALICVLSMVNTVWMVIINHPDLAMGSAVLFAGCSLLFMHEVKYK
jgi:hypothetical protein